jgi:hypothetical protein
MVRGVFGRITPGRVRPRLPALINGASRAVRLMALAGIRSRHPDAPDEELVARLARLTVDASLARRAYPAFGDVDDPSGP